MLERAGVIEKIACGLTEKLLDTSNHSIARCLDYHSADGDDYLETAKNYIDGRLSEADFLASAYRLHSTKQTKTCGAKEVLDLATAKYDWLEKLLSWHENRKVKYIFLERDIRGVTASFVKLGFFPPGKRKLNGWNMRKFAKAYAAILNTVVGGLRNENTLFLSFEKIVETPRAVFKKIFTFLDVEDGEKIVSDILDTPSEGSQASYSGQFDDIRESWRTVLTPKQADWLDRANFNAFEK